MSDLPESITVCNKQTIKRIELNKLISVLGDSYCSTFKIEGEKNFTCAKLLKEVEIKLLPANYFKRINRNTIVNMLKVSELDLKIRKLSLYTGEEFIVSVRQMKSVKKLLQTVSIKNQTLINQN